jgi:hypothetical protein
MLATKQTDKSLKMSEIRRKAENLGIDAGSLDKTELIHAIQQAEGYAQCYGRSNGQCTQMDCCFRADCLRLRL